MYLTKEEEQIQSGEAGETLRKAIEILVALGDIYGADRLIPIKSAQIAGVSYKTIGDAGLEWISDLEGQVKVPAILNPAGMDLEDWERLRISSEFAEKQKRIVQAYKKLGIRCECTCTPYTLKGFSAGYGDHLAWSESSAISYANSVIGARTNREGGPSALSAALLGKTANYGFHLDENRVPEVLISVECSLKESDYGALGYVAGKIIGSRVPIFRIKDTPEKDELKALGAAMAASGSVALYHVKGVTPEACRLDFKEPEEKIIIERSQLDEVYESRKRAGKEPELITIGCPHCSAAELKKVAELLGGKTVSKETWIFTSRELKNRYPEYIRSIEESGAKIVCDTCMVVSPATNSYSCVMVNSGKAFAYVPGMCGAESVYGDIEACIEEATGGKGKKAGGSH
ncbi:aconitase X [Methanosarcina sp.]|uniref:aconitase X n=1 Tax=Methanosarcina sp. TaxID=2213 RepID=UPI002ABB810E|nr:aconitase X [Methanosarcina sp.]MDY9924806.1 aconitase X [Methanosarcina sp.]